MTLAPDTILATDRLTMRFGGLFAVNELDLNVREGAIHSIIGPNGAGKTTVFNCIMQNLQDFGREDLVSQRADGWPHARPRRRGRSEPHLPEHSAVPECDGYREPSGRHASSSSLPLVGSAHHSPHTRRSEKEAHDEALKLLRFVGLQGPRRRPRPQSRLRRAATARNGKGSGDAAETALARRADCRNESARDLRDDGLHPRGA